MCFITFKILSYFICYSLGFHIPVTYILPISLTSDTSLPFFITIIMIIVLLDTSQTLCLIMCCHLQY